MEELLTIYGKFTHIRYRHELNGFTVASFKMNDHQEKTITVTGKLPSIDMHALYECKGYYSEHIKYGLQFVIEEIKFQRPTDEEALVHFFSSTRFSGIGKVSAQKIVDTFGLNAIEMIQNDPSILSQIFTKKDDKRINSIVSGLKNYDQLDDDIIFFNQIGLNVRAIEKIQVVYGKEAVPIIKENPYRLIEDIDGIGFKTSDKIASILGFENNHPYRLRALIESQVLEVCITNGNSYIEKDEFLHSFEKRIQKENIDIDDFDYNNCFQQLQYDRFIVVEENRIYHHTQYDAEAGIAQFLKSFPYVYNYETQIPNLDDEIKIIEDELNIQYEIKQIEAIKMFFNHPFSILTGGPGTGKTTIVKAILTLYKKFFPSDQVMLAAPTGRASKRLSECSNTNASTLHRLLKWDLETNSFLVNEEEPLYLDCLIIDEFSMVDQWLFYNLCKAAKKIKKILIIGDEDQLPSVGIGTVLKDCIESNQFPLLRLEKIFRQSEGSDIVELAYEMKQGKCDILSHGKDIAFFECPSNLIKDQILNIVDKAFEKGYFDHDIQILS
ncbi:MAG: AAA family ATPase, partial [Traorella sp.]